jgi:basic membrane protein A
VLAVVAVLALGGAATALTLRADDGTDDPPGGGGAAGDFAACAVTDPGGTEDAYNEVVVRGLERAGGELGFTPEVEEPTPADEPPALADAVERLASRPCDLTVTVGGRLADATAQAAGTHPDKLFAIVDHDYGDGGPANVRSLTFAIEEAAYLAGYVAAAMSDNHVIGTYGYAESPTVQAYVGAFRQGILRYGAEHGVGNIQLIGDDDGDDALRQRFQSTDQARAATEDLIAARADVIFPVAGPSGHGSIEAIQAGGGGEKLIWADTDGGVTFPDAGDLFLTSAMKNYDVAAHETATAAADGSFEAGLYTGTLANGGVGIAELHDSVPGAIRGEVDELRAEIESGDLDPLP